jgi:Cu/Ag efflux protein CusF
MAHTTPHPVTRTPLSLTRRTALVLASLLVGTAAHAQAGETLGEVRKVDAPGAKITLKHGEIKHLAIPPMTMTYLVKDKAMLTGVNTGDKVWFTAEKIDGQYVVTVLKPAGK